jgi:hypothetical protein
LEGSRGEGRGGEGGWRIVIPMPEAINRRQKFKLLEGREGGWRIVITMPEAINCVEGRMQIHIKQRDASEIINENVHF